MRIIDKAISIISAIIMFSVLIPSSVGVEGAPDTWTFMVYMDADNELEEYALKNFMQMSEVSSLFKASIF